MKRIYLDHSATTPLLPEVKDEVVRALNIYGNASSMHAEGVEARREIEKVRVDIAKFINAKSDKEILFTSGGSEANNLVLKGVVCGSTGCKTKQKSHIITSAIEHPSVLSTLQCKCKEECGDRVTFLPVDKYGMVNPADVEKAIREDTGLISIMHANNEIGTIQPIKEIAAIAKKHGVLFHTDAVQTFGKIPIDVEELGVDMLSFSGHKLNAPKGIGGLYVRRGIKICPLIEGGHQERGKRAGTENILGILALGKAIEIAKKDMIPHAKELEAMRNKLLADLQSKITDVTVNGHPEKHIPGLLNVTFKYIEGESILMMLSAKGIAVSTGSACSTGSLEPSHVILAIGLPHEDAHGSIRFSFGRFNEMSDVDYVAESVQKVVKTLRDMSPLL